MEHEGDGDTNCCTRNNPHRIVRDRKTEKSCDRSRPSRLQPCWYRLEHREEYWRLKEACYHSNCCREPSANAGGKNFVFITLGTLNRPDFHFEGAGNGPVVINWIGREDCCAAVHLRSRSLNIVSLSDMIESSYRSWDLYTTGQLVDGLQQKKENWFSLNGNWIMSFLGRQFYRSTMYYTISVAVLSFPSIQQTQRPENRN